MRLPGLLLFCAVAGLPLAADSAAATGSAAAMPATSFSRGGPLPKWAAPLAAIPATTREDAAVLRLWEVQLLGGAAPAVLVNQAIQVNEREALKSIGQYAFSYNPSFEQVRLLRVAIIRNGDTIDRTASANVRLLERESELDAGVYGGEKTVQLLLEDIRVGDTLWITYVTEGANPVFGKRMAKEFNLERAGMPVELRRITVLHPAAQAVRWKQFDADGTTARTAELTPVVDKVGDMQRLRFEARGLERAEPEPSMPGDVRWARAVQLSDYASWQEVAAWADGLFPRLPATPAIKTLARRFAAEPGALARASAALRYVQEEIRYFSVSIGENSHRPQAPATVLARRYGDCKDKSYLLVALLAELGIKARPLLLNTTMLALADGMLPTPSMFDHAIVRIEIDGAFYLVDPTRTAQRGSIDALPTVFPGARGLVVDASTTALLPFPQLRADELARPEYELTENVAIDAFDGDARLEATMRYTGNYAEWARRHYGGAGAAQMRREALARYEKRYPGVTLEGQPALNDSAADGSIELLARYTLPKPVTVKDGNYHFEYDSEIMDDTLGIPAKVVRQFPLALPQGAYRGRYHLNLRWPATVRAADTPAAATLDTPWFAAHEEYALRGNLLSHLVDYRLKQATVAAADLPALAKQGKALNAYASGSWRISEAVVSAPAYLRFTERDFGLVRNAQALPADAAETKKIVDPDEICGMALKGSRLYLAEMPLDKDDTLMQTAPLAAQPDSPAVRACRAELAFNEGRFADAVPLFNGKGDEQHGWLLMRSWAQLHAGSLTAARADIDKYVGARRAAGALTALDAAHALAIYQRSGQAAPAALTGFARDYADGPWPRPLLALQAAGAAPAAIEQAALAVIDAMPPGAQALPRDELWFFLGQRRLAAGDKAGARAAFQRLVDQGDLRGLLVPLARAELPRPGTDDADIAAAYAAGSKGDSAGVKRHLDSAARRGVPAAWYELALLARTAKADPAEVLRLATQSEQAGYSEAINLLGVLYFEGGAVPWDRARARALFERAYDAGASSAPRNLAKYHLEGLDGTPRDRARGMALLRVGANRNDGGAQALLAASLYLGPADKADRADKADEADKADDSEAWYWARRAGQRGDYAGFRQMATMLLAGRGVERNPAQAIRLLEAAVTDGDSEAMLMLARVFDNGDEQIADVPKDARRAYALVQQAVAAGNAAALHSQGLRLVKGGGVEADPAKGLALLEQAAAKGDNLAALALADLYMFGKGVPKDAVQGARALRMCAERGYLPCQENYANALHFDKLLPHDYAAAASWYRKAADQGSAVSLNNLGDLYENGQGVPRDYATALRLYREAAQLRLPFAFLSLGTLYEKGIGVPVQAHTAYAMYRLAERLAERGHSDQLEAAGRASKLGASLESTARALADTLAEQWQPGLALPGEGQ